MKGIWYSTTIMPKQCTICEKQYNMAWRRVKLRGKFNPTAKHMQKPNLQWLGMPGGGRVKACTKCIKAVGKGT